MDEKEKLMVVFSELERQALREAGNAALSNLEEGLQEHRAQFSDVITESGLENPKDSHYNWVVEELLAEVSDYINQQIKALAGSNHAEADHARVADVVSVLAAYSTAVRADFQFLKGELTPEGAFPDIEIEKDIPIPPAVQYVLAAMGRVVREKQSKPI